MAWMELLPEMGVDRETVAEMNKDVNRLSTIAQRFGKVGSVPQMAPADLNALTSNATGYMKSRISSRIALETHTDGGEIPVMACGPLFEWVMENLIKNAADAMDGNGRITVTTGTEPAAPILKSRIRAREFRARISKRCSTRDSRRKNVAGAWD